ncbi:Uncharacterised protein [Escherichia coli]|uniref:Uncharacterized protein n=1 Tax=Escherichia coli TaxID=562 RepID=A0A376KRI8_ECOLX|nr:Uncharacterised protein [Escherichia coli]
MFLGEFCQLTQLFRDNKAVLLIANHHRAFALHAVQAADGGLQHGEIAFQA